MTPGQSWSHQRMLLDLTPEQEFFQETTAKFLANQVPPAVLQRFAGDVPADFEAGYWQRGADLGWTSLLVSEEAGGGSISGNGVTDLALIAFEFGRHAAPGPLVPANIVAAALNDALASGAAHEGPHAGPIAELLAGTATAAWCHDEPRRGLLAARLAIRAAAGDLVLDGVKRPVEAAGMAKYLLVTGHLEGTDGDGLTQVLVPADAAGIAIAPLRTADYGKRMYQVSFTGVRVPATAVVGAPGRATAQVERQLQLASVMLSAETAGAMQTGFDMTLSWAFDRYSFGRPLASYQAIKHRFADLKTTLESSHAITGAAAAAMGEDATAGGQHAAELASAAKAYTGQYGPELIQDCVQLHGGIGLTLEHDLHLYLRRVITNAMLHGTPADHRERIAGIVEQREGLTDRVGDAGDRA
jgi:alkylation response protein AidB-like acyl-CoA dehydrogenase